MTLNMIFSFIACLVIVKCSSSASSPGQRLDQSQIWAFDRYSFSDQITQYNQEKSSILLKNFNFGPFGASKMVLRIKSLSALQNILKNVSIHFDNANAPATKLSYIPNTNSAKENTLAFDLESPDGVHYAYISIPSNIKSSDLSSVQFYTADPKPGQWYALISDVSDKAITGCNSWEYGCVRTYMGISEQKVKFEKVSEGGFKIVTDTKKVLTVKNGGTGNKIRSVVENFINLPYQLWYIQPFSNSFQFRPKHDFSKCLEVFDSSKNQNAEVGTYDCNFTGAQKWYIVAAC